MPIRSFRKYVTPSNLTCHFSPTCLKMWSASLIPLWVTILVVSRDLILMLGTAVAHFTDSRVDITPTFLGKGTTFLQLSYVVLVIFLSSRHIDLTVILPLLFGMVSFTLLSGLHYLYRGIRQTSAIRS